jgi:2-polyprenyl-3-methyl-5-hydroxy-6-metoxy-1,4-benzoquinol methylase
MSADHTDNERWYLALTELWAARMRAGLSAPGTDKQAGPDVSFASEVMELAPGSRVLDLACAWGRTTLELARRGYAATGLDIAPHLLAIARERAAAERLEVAFVEGTVRRLPSLGSFDAVTEFYDDSVISYEDEADNLAALRGVTHQLRPGGRFLFGTGDYPRLMPPHQRRSRQEMGHEIVEEIFFDQSRMIGTSIREHAVDGRRTTYRRVRRHYTADQVADLLAGAGMRLLAAWSGYSRILPYTPPRDGMVLLAARE